MATTLSCSLPTDGNKAARKMKPYGCVLCKRAFSKATNLQKHLMGVHGITEESDEDDDAEEEEDYRVDVGCIESQHDDSINLIADAAGVHGDISGDSRDAEEALSCLQPAENSQRDPLKDSDQPGTESNLLGDGNENDVADQEQTTATIQTLQVNPSDIIAQAAAGANILMGEKDSEQETQSICVDMETQIIAEKEDLSEDPHHVGVVKDTANLLVEYCPQVQTATLPEDSVSVETDEERSQCKEMIPQVFPVALLRTTFIPNKGSPSPSRTRESSQTPVVTNYVGGEVQEKKTVLSSSRRRISRQAVTSNNKTLRSRERTLHRSAQVSDHAKKQEVGIDQRPQVRRSGRSAKRKIDKDFLMESVEQKKKNLKKQQKEKKREEEEEQRKEEKRKEEQEKRGKKQKKRNEEKKREKLKRPSRDLPEKNPDCSAVTRRKRKTLEEKLADLHRAHEETEKLNILVQKIVNERPGCKTEAKDLPLSRKRKSSPVTKTNLTQTKCNSTKAKSNLMKPRSHLTVSKTKKTYDCLSCSEKFSSLSECINHMRRVHLSISPIESEEPYPSDLSSTFDEEEEEEYVEELPKTSPGSGPRKRGQEGSGRGGQYSCKYCSEVSKSLEGQRVHMSVHCGLVDRKCFRCQIYDSRPSAAQLEDIERSVEKVRDTTNADGYEFKRGKQLLVQFYQCILCNSCYAVEKHLRNHMSQHKVIICQVCNGVFSSTKALGKHIPHHRTGPLSCKTCGQTFFSSYMLLVHMRGHTNDYRCKYCDATFMFPANLSRHINQRHTDNKNCNQGSVDKISNQEERTSKRKDHTRGTKDNPKLICRFCGNLHFFETTLKRHIEKYHPESVENRGNFVCEICGAVKHKFTQLRKHMICHEQPKQKCRLCSKVFVRISSLKQHIQQVHEGRKDFTCQYCGKGISSSTSLQDHERLHTGEKPFVCLDCGKSFRLRQMYTVHMRREHSTDKSFRCSQCGKGFYSRSSLAKHKKIHAPNEDSMCPDCGKQFKRKDLLRIHLVKHRQAMQCLKCNRRFSSEVALKYHMNKLHNINLYRTDYDQVNLSEGLLHTQQSQMLSDVENLPSVADAPGDLTSISLAAEKNPISVTVTNRNSKTRLVDASGNSGDNILPTQSATKPANNLPLPYGTDRRLSDPTNVAISTILSQLMHTSVPE